ncbi:hypothetical protein BDV06DRAFT_218133 [Aspergillus oleicola]
MYPEKSQWLADRIERAIYPNGFTRGEEQRTVIRGYSSRPYDDAISPAGIYGRALMEATPWNHWETTPDGRRLRKGRFRLFANAGWTADVDFFSGTDEYWAKRSDESEDDCQAEAERKPCSPETCKDDTECSIGGGRGDWVVAETVDCASIPTKTVNALPGPTEGLGNIDLPPPVKNGPHKRSDLIKRQYNVNRDGVMPDASQWTQQQKKKQDNTVSAHFE